MTYERLEKEEWRDIAGYERVYQASTLGRVRRVRRRYDSIKPDLNITRILKPKPAGPRRTYRQVCLCWLGIRHYVNVHRLIAETFIPNPDNLPEVNHISGDGSDNRVANLEWMTISDNRRDAHARCLETTGEPYTSRLTREQAVLVRELCATGKYRYADIAERFGVAISSVGDIVCGRTWAYLGSPIQTRKPRGGHHKITNDDAQEIRRLYATGQYRYIDLSGRFGISIAHVGNVVREEQ